MKEEKYIAGETVYLIHLKQEAKITRIANAEMVFVEADGDEIPVYKSDIRKKDSSFLNNNDEKPTIPVVSQAQVFRNRTNKGIFVSFDPQSNKEGDVHSFNVYLINDNASAIDFSYKFSLGNTPEGRKPDVDFSLQKILGSYDFILLHSIVPDHLNEMPQVYLTVRELENKFKGTLNQKIKPRNFFNKLAATPLVEKETYQYRLILELKNEKIETPKPAPPAIDHEVLKMMMMSESPINKDIAVESAVEEIDLHIEKLTTEYKSMNNGEMMQMQLARFQQALERAISHGAHRLYVIHGVGKGRLKDEIHGMLKSYRDVKSFNNNYHSRYGYGATEVILHL